MNNKRFKSEDLREWQYCILNNEELSYIKKFIAKYNFTQQELQIIDMYNKSTNQKSMVFNLPIYNKKLSSDDTKIKNESMSYDSGSMSYDSGSMSYDSGSLSQDNQLVKTDGTRDLFNSNSWSEIKKVFLDQYEKYKGQFNIDNNYNLFDNTKMTDLGPEYSQEFINKKDGENKKIFSVSLFSKPGATFTERDIQTGGNGLNFDKYVEHVSGNYKDIEQKKKDDLKRDLLTYFEILFKNIKLYKEEFPEWIIRIYTDNSIINSQDETIKKYYQILKEKDIEIVKSSFNTHNISITNGHKGIATMISRFLPMFDENVREFIVIEADNWPTKAYFKILKNWIENKDLLCLSFISGNKYGWPSGILNEDETLHYFIQNYGGMFGLRKPNNKNYNKEIFNDLYKLATKRQEIFNKNLFDLNGTPKYNKDFYGLLNKKIDSLIDFGIDEVWLSIVLLPKIEKFKADSIYTIPIFGDFMNFNILDNADKTEIITKLGLNPKLSELNLQATQSVFRYLGYENRQISTSIEILLTNQILGLIEQPIFNIDNYKYEKKILPTFNNIYPGWNYAENYDKLLEIMSQISIGNDLKNYNSLILKQKYLKYKQKYLTLRKKLKI